MRHSISTKLLVIKGKILSPPKGTHKEFASSKLAATAGVSKGKSSKKSIPGIGKPSPSTSKIACIPLKQPSISTGEEEGPISSDIPTVPVLRSPPPYGFHVHQTPLPAESMNMSIDSTTDSDNVSGYLTQQLMQHVVN